MGKFACLKYLAVAAALSGATVEAQGTSTPAPITETCQTSHTLTNMVSPSVTPSPARTSNDQFVLTSTSTAPSTVIADRSSLTNTSTASSVTITSPNGSSLTYTSTASSVYTTSPNQSSLTTNSMASSSVTTSSVSESVKSTGAPSSDRSSLTYTSTASSVTTTSPNNSSPTYSSTASSVITTHLNNSSHTSPSTASSVITTSLYFTTLSTSGTPNATAATTQFPETSTGTSNTTTAGFNTSVPTTSTFSTAEQTDGTNCDVYAIDCTVSQVTDANITMNINYNISESVTVFILNQSFSLNSSKIMEEIIIENLTFCTKYNLSVTVNNKCPTFCENIIATTVPLHSFDFSITSNSPHFSINEPSDMKKCNFTYNWKCTNGTVNEFNGTVLNISTPCQPYNCVITLKTGNWSKVKNKTLQAETEEPNMPVIRNQSVTNTSIELEWNVTITPLKPVNNVIIKCKTSGESKEQEHTCKRNQKSSKISGSHRCADLKPYKSYTCYAKAENENCNHVVQSTMEANITVNTHQGCPVKPKILYIKPLSNNAISITCVNLSNDEWNGMKGSYSARLESNSNGNHKIENRAHCSFEFKDLSYLSEYKLMLQAIGPVCTSFSDFQTYKTGYNEQALIGFLAFLIIATTIALAIVLYKIYILQRKSSRHPEESVELIGHDDEKQLLNVEPILAEQLIDVYRRKQADESRLFLAEFQSIPRVFSKFPVKDARRGCNSNKNRYIDILPYDYNRVELSPVSGEHGSDYINASFIDGFNEPRKYIAAQGPKEETSDDFWKMVWEQKVTIIVMVTRCEEGKRPKCAQYWPTMDAKSMYFGDFSVRISEEKLCPDYVIRKLFISQKEKSPEREVTHIQFISWPDHGVPEDPHLLLKLRQRVNTFRNLFSGPIVVHCSAGVGRTGSYIGIDAMLQALEAEGRVDVYGYIVQLRRQRCLMVQVEAQYILIHQALLEYYLYGETEVNLSELPKHLSNFRKRDPPTEPSLLEAEFQRIPFYTEWRSQVAARHTDNQSKNRSLSVIPYDYNRVYVKMESDKSKENETQSDTESSSDESDDEESTRYINASYIEGYWHYETLIATQTPLPKTIADFWAMIYQKKTKLLIFLGQVNEDKDCTQYWEDEKKIYEDLEVKLTECNEQPEFTVQVFEIRHIKKETAQKVYQYNFREWKECGLPESPSNFITMMRSIKQKLSVLKDDQSGIVPPVVVHCSDGSKRTGIFYTLWNLLDSADNEKIIDVLQTVKALRKQRPGVIPTFEQYEFLYDVIVNTYPVQNGTLVSGNGSAQTSVEVISETPLENKSQEGAGSDSIENKKEASAEEDKAKSGSSNIKQPIENPTNGPITSDENV